MQRLDDAHVRAEGELAAWLARKPKNGNWRVLLVKDVLAKLRVVLWCPSNEWESGRAEVKEMLCEAATVGDYLKLRRELAHLGYGHSVPEHLRARPSGP